jgi:hypothetical protein
MPQNNNPVLTVRPVNASGLQEPISLGTGNLIGIGSPGGPVIFTNYGAMIVPALFGNSVPGSVVGGR